MVRNGFSLMDITYDIAYVAYEDGTRPILGNHVIMVQIVLKMVRSAGSACFHLGILKLKGWKLQMCYNFCQTE